MPETIAKIDQLISEAQALAEGIDAVHKKIEDNNDQLTDFVDYMYSLLGLKRPSTNKEE